ncbi:MAG: 30S ribosomal protein S20 [bacterium]|nr:30S ribosomal protein S20 [bacterium]
MAKTADKKRVKQDSAEKRTKQAEKRRLNNLARKTAIKTAIKKVLLALEGNNIDQAKELLRDAQSKISRAKTKGVLHRNTAARKIGRLAKKIASAGRPASV